MSNQNAYEVRLKILELAQSQLISEAMAKTQKADAKWEADQISFPTEDQVLEVAKKFDTFVSGK